MSTSFSVPSKRSTAINEEMICASHRFKLVYVGRSIPELGRHMSSSATHLITTVATVCSSKECVPEMVLECSATA